MGRGASNVAARVAASQGALNAVAPQFQRALDVPYGGVLLVLPALLALGLLEGSEESLNRLPAGYYGLDTLLMLLAFMALGRLQSMEALRYTAPGEWGKLLGLDRAADAYAAACEALDIFIEVGDRYGRAAALHTVGRICIAQQRRDEAVDHLRRAVGIYRDLRSTRDAGKALAELHAAEGRPTPATG